MDELLMIVIALIVLSPSMAQIWYSWKLADERERVGKGTWEGEL